MSAPIRHNQRWKADLALLFTALIWGSAFVVQRLAAVEAGVFYFNGLRFLVGALGLLPFALRSRRLKIARPLDPAAARRPALPWLLLAGLLLFAGGTFQQWGLVYTTAGNAGFITGLYVVLIPLILAVGWRRPPRPAAWLAALLAAAGLFLLSTGGRLALNPGDGLELVGAVLFALHVLLIGWLVEWLDVLALSAIQYAVCGLASLAFGFFLEAPSWGVLAANAWAVAYTGLISVGIGYTLQAYGQRLAPAADAAILLSLEAAFAALFGWLILDEHLLGLQLLGCGLMFAGMLLAQAPQFRRSLS